MSGASTNNLNRVHLGCHYPRDDMTARQSQKGYESFKSLFKNSLISNFDNYYLISNHNSKVNFSGSLEEAELKLINYDSVDLLNYEETYNSFNLDDDWRDYNNNINQDFSRQSSKYDFVFCNQVLEHIYSPIQGIKNIYYITKNNCYAFISIPTINRIHGEPHFYSAGYHPRYLNRLCREAGFKVLHIGAWGSRKYLAYAVQGSWKTHDGLKPGFREKLDLGHPYFAIVDGRKNSRGVIITDTWALIKKL